MQSGTVAYLIRRTLFLVPLMIGLSLVMFTLIHTAPGDPVLALLGERGADNPDFVEQTRKNLGWTSRCRSSTSSGSGSSFRAISAPPTPSTGRPCWS